MNSLCPLGAIDEIQLLDAVNWVLLGGGWGVVVVVAVYWCVKVRRDPIACVSDIPNQLLPEAVLLPGLAWLAVGGLGGLIAQKRYGEEWPVVALLWIGDAAQIAGAVACLLVAAKCFDGGARRFIVGQGRVIHDVGAAFVWAPAAVAVCPVIAMITLWGLTSIDPNYVVFEHRVIDALRTEDLAPWVLWIGAVVIAPVAEECFFRGLLQTYLVKLLGRRWPAILLTGTLFGVIHAGGRDAPQPHVVPAMMVLGIMLGVLYARRGALIAPITVHALFNLKTLALETLSLRWG